MDTIAPPVALESAPAVTTEAPVMTLTPRAVEQVKEVMKAQSLEGHFLTIRVVPAGCSGLGYDLNLLDTTKPGDLVWTQDGIRVCTDELSVQYLKGTQVDYVKNDVQAGFKFENPNAKSSCGCGSSFSA